jgi:hypothetical protein
MLFVSFLSGGVSDIFRRLRSSAIVKAFLVLGIKTLSPCGRLATAPQGGDYSMILALLIFFTRFLFF